MDDVAALFLSVCVLFFAVVQPGIADVKLQSEKEANVKASAKLEIAKEVRAVRGCRGHELVACTPA